MYFELIGEEFEQCEKIKAHHLVCSSNNIKKIDTNPNCVIDYIYDPEKETSTCPLRKHKLRNVIWKQLKMRKHLIVYCDQTPKPRSQ